MAKRYDSVIHQKRNTNDLQTYKNIFNLGHNYKTAKENN
jgi:hypothetical protein